MDEWTKERGAKMIQGKGKGAGDGILGTSKIQPPYHTVYCTQFLEDSGFQVQMPLASCQLSATVGMQSCSAVYQRGDTSCVDME